MEGVWELFQEVALPYEYVKIPDVSEPAIPRDKSLYFYVNRVITGLSKRAFARAGISLSSTVNKFNFSWGRQYEAPQYSKCKSWQKINHFAGAFLMGRKDDFHARMTELKDRIHEEASFYPESYLLPNERDKLEKVFTSHRIWIVKPAAAARGTGIKLISSDQEIPSTKGIFQVYIERPMLIDGRKFDLRLYVLVTSITPLRIYMYKDGLARFASHKYDSEISVKDIKANLTNFALNKDDKAFVMAQGGTERVENSKWSLTFFMNYLKEKGIDTDALLKELERVTITTVIGGVCAIRKHHRKYIPHRHTSYELYGIDILLDEDLKPYVMEINISPGMDGSESLLDKRLKEPLMNETLKMARFIKCKCTDADPCPGIDRVDEIWRTSMNDARREDVMQKGVDPWESPVFGDFVSVRDFMEERAIKSGFRRVYPKRKTVLSFNRCFDVLEYPDFVLQQWVLKSNDEREKVIRQSFDTYKSVMDDIHRQLHPEDKS